MITQEDLKTEQSKVPYVEVKNLVTRFFTSKGIVKALEHVSLQIYPGEVYGLVGESGCGKSVTSSSIMDLIPDPPGRIVEGEIYIDGFNILSDLKSLAKIRIRSETDVRIKRNKRAIKRHNFILSKIRGNKISMIFQEPFLALNPTITIGKQITEVIMLHNLIGIADSIIKRETMKTSDVEKLMEQLEEMDDYAVRRKLINQWTRNFGIPDLEISITSLIDNIKDKKYVVTEITQIILENQKQINLERIKEIKDYFSIEKKIFELSLNQIQYERNGEVQKSQEAKIKIRQLKGFANKKYLKLKILMKFFNKRVLSLFYKESRRRAIELLGLVNLAGPEIVVDEYPHELSGGMQQRAMIAMALASNPKMLIADEPTTALDVTTQAQILELITELNKIMGMSVLFITHDLAVIAEMCNKVGVMYAGNIVEETTTVEIFNDPKHPYTVGLMNSLPRADKKREKELKFETIPGNVPNLIFPPSGCRFNPRCKFAMDICSLKKPKLVEVAESHKVACFLYSNESEDDVN
ncbi:MAG: ABC transporter ATP-binding protein [Thermoplasmataceae archaeon]